MIRLYNYYIIKRNLNSADVFALNHLSAKHFPFINPKKKKKTL